MIDPLDPRARRGGAPASSATPPSVSVPARPRAPAPAIDADPLALDPLAPEAYDGADYDADSYDALDADGVELLDEDREILVALAAFQLRYGEDAEALAYLLAARTVFPDDADVLRLLAHALVKLGRTDEADEVLTELDRVARPTPPLALLSRALVRLAQGRMAEARRLFDRYRDARDDARDRAA